jgi:hypothetical protein
LSNRESRQAGMPGVFAFVAVDTTQHIDVASGRLSIADVYAYCL